MKRRHQLGSFAILSTFFILLPGCNNMLNGKASTPEGSAKVAGSEIDFKTVSTNVLKPMCLNCHSSANGTSGGVNLETYANAFAHLKEIRADVVDGSMPASGPSLNEEEKALILNWIDAGAPEFASTTPAPSGPTTTTTVPATPTTTLPTTTTTMVHMPTTTTTLPAPQPLRFNQVSAEVLQPKCVACHTSFSKYSTVYNQRGRIQSEIASGAMPKGSSLTATQKATILKWLAQGAPQ